MKAQPMITSICLAVVLVFSSALAAEKRQFNDAELDAVTAGNASESDPTERLSFDVVRRTRSGHTITADGSLEVFRVPPALAAGQLMITDRAQGNLQSVVNINAVNSVVNVLLNLNISIDSNIGGIEQTNLNGFITEVATSMRR